MGNIQRLILYKAIKKVSIIQKVEVRFMVRFRGKVRVKFRLEVRNRSLLCFNLRVIFRCRVSIYVSFHLD